MSARFNNKSMCKENQWASDITEYMKCSLVWTPLVVIAIFFLYLCKDFVKLQLKARAQRQNTTAWLAMQHLHNSMSVDTI